MERSTGHQVVCFGEVLWDILPSGAMPGGAPMNVTYHLHKLGKAPALITRVGKDKEGEELAAIFSGHGVTTAHFQWDEDHQTGKVYAFPAEGGEVTYDIVKPSAWDFIEWQEAYGALVAQAHYFVFGSLAARETHSRSTLLRLLNSAQRKVLDINLRAPHYTRPGVEELLGHADIVKLNHAELEEITNWSSGHSGLEGRMRSLAERFSLEAVVVTMGGDGAYLLKEEKLYTHPGFAVTVKDTIGSGDAFLAGLLARLMEGAAPEEALAFANGMGAFMATQTGACPHYTIGEVYGLMEQEGR